MEKSRRFSTIGLVVALVTLALSAPLIHFGWAVVAAWTKVHFRPVGSFYVGGWPSSWVLIIALAGPVVLLLISIGVLVSIRSSWPRWPIVSLPIATALTLCSLVIIPNLPLWDAELIQNRVHLGTMEHLLAGWGRDHGRFPGTENELEDALHGGVAEISIYQQRDHRLEYQTKFISNQTGPYRAYPERPAIVYYVVNQSGNQFWLTVSGLNAPVSLQAAMMRVDPLTASKQPWGDILVTTDVLVSVKRYPNELRH